MENDSGALIFGLFSAAVICGFIGHWAGSTKGREIAGTLLGLFLGPVGIIIVLVMPDAAAAPPPPIKRQMRKCPFCAEMILVEAVVCRYCQRDVPEYDWKKEPSLFTTSLGK